MNQLTMPRERDFAWDLKPTSSTFFGIHQRENGQFCVVLNHSLLRGVRSEMIHWWFQHFQNLHVTLEDVAGYEKKKVPAYYLWHPSDHIRAELVGKVGPEYKAQAGDKIHIQEVMQYKKYGMKYPVDKKLSIFYCESDGWAMGLKIPLLGEAMVLRISYKDVYDAGNIIGVHYHYEVVMGFSSMNFIARQLTKKVTNGLGPEFFEAWQLHNAIEVGVFENFLPAIYQQKDNLSDLRYSKSMNPKLPSPSEQTGFDEEFFKQRLAGYKTANDPFEYQAYMSASAN